VIPVNEIFETIQGEAFYAGTPSLFVRVQGCDVGCPWCDTKFTWALKDDDEHTLANVLAKTESASPVFARVSDDSIYAMAVKSLCRHVVLTGGEPCMYDLQELTGRLLMSGKTVQIETSGTQPVRAHADTWVTVSPKVNMPGGHVVLDAAVQRANEIKMPVGKPSDIDTLRQLLARLEAASEARPSSPLVWLQPLSQSPKATALCASAAHANGWRLSLQVHKYAGLR
jgi:7-carboxy-7-deazaguanine synthase